MHKLLARIKYDFANWQQISDWYKNLTQADAMNITGQLQVNDARLEMTFVADVIYIPASNSHPGGLYDNQLQPISHAITHRDNKTWLGAPLKEAIDLNKLPLHTSDKPYFFIGDIYNHYGHFIVESTARLWPLLYLPNGFAENYLYCGKDASEKLLQKTFIKDIYGSFSLSPDNFLRFNKPCRLQNVFIPLPAFEIRRQGNQLFRETMLHVGNHLAGDLSEINNSNLTPLYISKSKLPGGVSRIFNETAIEEALASKGIEIWHPETLDLASQIKELTSRKYLMGAVGSAFHNLLFCLGNKVISGVCLGEKLNSSYLIIDKLCGNNARYVIGKQSSIALSTDPKLCDRSRFVNTFYATNPKQTAELLLRNLQL